MNQSQLLVAKEFGLMAHWLQVLSQVVEVLSATAKQHGAAWVPTIQSSLLPLVIRTFHFLSMGPACDAMLS